MIFTFLFKKKEIKKETEKKVNVEDEKQIEILQKIYKSLQKEEDWELSKQVLLGRLINKKTEICIDLAYSGPECVWESVRLIIKELNSTKRHDIGMFISDERLDEYYSLMKKIQAKIDKIQANLKNTELMNEYENLIKKIGE